MQTFLQPFLNGELEEEVYVQQPPGFPVGPKGQVCKLKKALYGLKQAPVAWHNTFTNTLREIGLEASKSDAGLYLMRSDDEMLLAVLYVDDITLAAPPASSKLCSKVIELILTAYKGRYLGEPKFFIGMKISRDRENQSLSLSQEKAILELADQFNIEVKKSKTVPLNASVRLGKNEGDQLENENCNYQSLIGSLNYISVCTRPDISYAVGALSRFLENPTRTHWQAALGVLQYLVNTSSYAITYNGNRGIEFRGYCDADYAGDVDNRRSTTGGIFTIAGGAVSWMSKLQKCVVVSSCEAEYVAASTVTREALFMRNILRDMTGSNLVVDMNADNQGALKLIRNPISSMRSKHIDIAYHFVRDRAAAGHIRFKYISTHENVADILTKPLGAESTGTSVHAWVWAKVVCLLSGSVEKLNV